MKRSATALFLFAVAAFCQTPKDGGISGKITDAVTHEPISGAKVSCSAPCAGESAMSDANGYWSFPAGSTAPPPGSDPGVVVSVSKSGYATLGPIGLPMHAGVHATHDFELSPSASLTGRLLDRDSGKPIRAHLVTVTLRNPQPGQKTKFESKETAEDGSFAIGDLYAGEYTLEIDPSMTGRIHSGVSPEDLPMQFAWGPAWYPDAPLADMAAPVILSAGENRTVEVRLVKRHMRRIVGIIEVPNGIQAGRLLFEMQSLTGANVRLRQETSPGPFYIDGLDEGTYLVHVSNTRIDSPSAAGIIETGDRDIDDLHLTLRDPLDIRVETRIAEPDAKLAESLYLLLSSSDGSGRDFLIKADGPGHHLRVPAGEYIPLIQTHRPGFAVSSVTYAGRPVDYYMPIGIETPESVITVTLTSRPGRIIGAVRSFDRNPAPGATIVLLPAAIAASIEQADPGSPREMIRMAQVLKYAAEWKIAMSDSTGAFHFDDLAPDEYRAVALGTDDGRHARDLVSMRDHLRDATRVTVEASQTANLYLQIR